MEILSYVGFAFVGGVILNVMPCVLPVLSLKIYKTIEAYGQGKAAEHRAHSIAYAAGTTGAFLAFSVPIILLRAAGQAQGWGMQFQHPEFVAALTALMVAAGLNALGVFTLSVSGSGAQGEGLWGAFGNGVFAAVMSTPCTAPYLGFAAGFALAIDTADWQTVLLFATMGFGLAFPYLVIGFIPGTARLLPRPGAWMETFKQLMGFTLLGAAVWLFGAFQNQVSPDAANYFLAFLLVLAIALWAMERFATVRHAALRRMLVRLGLLGAVTAAGLALIRFDAPVRGALAAAAGFDDAPVVSPEGIRWRPFDPKAMSLEHSRQRAVFVDYTADWCAACKANEKLVLETDTVRQALLESGVLPMKADMTNEDPVLEEWLGRLERDGKKLSGIPAYVVYLPDQRTEVLPTVITTALVAEHLKSVAARFPHRVAAN